MGTDAVSAPPGLSFGDRLRWVQLSPRAREKATKRLGAVRTWKQRRWADRPVAPGEAKELAAVAGVSVKRFYELVSAWTSSPRLEALGVRAMESGSRSTTLDEAVRRSVVLQMEKALNADHAVGTEEILRSLDAGDVHRSTLLRWLADARRRLSPGDAFGWLVQFDHAYLFLADEVRTPLALTVAFDFGSAIALGWRVTAADHVWMGYEETARDGACNVDKLRIAGFETFVETPSLEIIRPVQQRYEGNSFVAHLPPDTNVRDGGQVRVARPIARFIGTRFGLLKSSPHPVDLDRLVPSPRSEIEKVVYRAMRSHNQMIVRRADDRREERSEREARKRVKLLLEQLGGYVRVDL
jgi:hypothetical protein